MERHLADPEREARVGSEALDEAEGVREAVYGRSVERLEEHLLARYALKRAEKPMNRALLSVIAYFRYHFLDKQINMKRLGSRVNYLVRKLRDRTLADLAAADLGVEPTAYDDDARLWLIAPEVEAAMAAEGHRWRDDPAVQEQKDAWARERTAELVRLTFLCDYDVADEADYLNREERYGVASRSARDGVDPWRALRGDYVDPTIIKAWLLLGFRQLGQPDGTAYYGGR